MQPVPLYSPYELLCKCLSAEATEEHLHTKPTEKLARAYNARDDCHYPKLEFDNGKGARRALAVAYREGTLDLSMIELLIAREASHYKDLSFLQCSRKRDYVRAPDSSRPMSNTRNVFEAKLAKFAQNRNLPSLDHSSDSGNFAEADLEAQRSLSLARLEGLGSKAPAAHQTPLGASQGPSGVSAVALPGSAMSVSPGQPGSPARDTHLGGLGGVSGLPPGGIGHEAISQPSAMELLMEIRAGRQELAGQMSGLTNRIGGIEARVGDMASKEELNNALTGHRTTVNADVAQQIESHKIAMSARITEVETLAKSIENQDAIQADKIVNDIKSSKELTAAIRSTIEEQGQDAVKSAELADLKRELLEEMCNRELQFRKELREVRASQPSLQPIPPHLAFAYTEDFRAGAITYREAVNENLRRGICQVVILDKKKVTVDPDLGKIPEPVWLKKSLGLDYHLLGTPHTSNGGNLVCKVRLTGRLPHEIRKHLKDLNFNRHKLGGLALGLITPEAHNIDRVLNLWRDAGLLAKHTVTKVGFYIVILNDGDSTLDLNVPADRKAYMSTCTRYNVTFPRRLSLMREPSVANIRKLAKLSHILGPEGQMVKVPKGAKNYNLGKHTVATTPIPDPESDANRLAKYLAQLTGNVRAEDMDTSTAEHSAHSAQAGSAVPSALAGPSSAPSEASPTGHKTSRKRSRTADPVEYSGTLPPTKRKEHQQRVLPTGGQLQSDSRARAMPPRGEKGGRGRKTALPGPGHTQKDNRKADKPKQKKKNNPNQTGKPRGPGRPRKTLDQATTFRKPSTSEPSRGTQRRSLRGAQAQAAKGATTPNCPPGPSPSPPSAAPPQGGQAGRNAGLWGPGDYNQTSAAQPGPNHHLADDDDFATVVALT